MLHICVSYIKGVVLMELTNQLLSFISPYQLGIEKFSIGVNF